MSSGIGKSEEHSMGWIIESSSNPAFHIGEQMLVSGIIGVWTKWEKPLQGRVIGLALESAFNPEDIPEGPTAPWQYHIVLEDGTHVYSIENQLERISTIRNEETT